jgi:hypothetical protein
MMTLVRQNQGLSHSKLLNKIVKELELIILCLQIKTACLKNLKNVMFKSIMFLEDKNLVKNVTSPYLCKINLIKLFSVLMKI